MDRAAVLSLGAALAFMWSGENRMLSAAVKKPASPHQRRDQGQIACTVDRCHRIPAGCHPETGYNWDGLPTRFDIVVCDSRRNRRRQRRVKAHRIPASYRNRTAAFR